VDTLQIQPKTHLVWDLPLRLFHWLLALSVIAAIITAQIGGNWMDWHGRIGINIIALLAFRLAWGIVGTAYARFAQFAPTPKSILAYVRGQWRGAGHNPLGALSVFALLFVLLSQALSGLYSYDDIAYSGPLYNLVGESVSNRLGSLHYLLSNVIYALLALHLGAIIFYARVKKQNLVRPMLTGYAEASDHTEQPEIRGGGLLALALALLFAAVAAYAASGVWIAAEPSLPTTPESTMPTW